jgi:hypothetical protein
LQAAAELDEKFNLVLTSQRAVAVQVDLELAQELPAAAEQLNLLYL